MKTITTLVFALTLAAASAHAIAGVPLHCAQNEKTFEVMCYADKSVRVNGDVRSAKLWRGGPKDIQETTFTARVHCVTRVLELTDSKGIAFVRNVPKQDVGTDFVNNMCRETALKRDPNLSTK